MKALFTLFLTLNCFFIFAQPGKIDTTFNSVFYSAFGTGNGYTGNTVREVCEQPDGKLIVAGGSNEYNGIIRYGISRLNPDGSLDLSFDPGNIFQYNTLYYDFTSLALQSDGKIITIRTEYNGLNISRIRRLNPDGSLDSAPVILGEIEEGIVHQSLIQPDGKLILCGDFAFVDTDQTYYFDLIRINTDGSLDNTFAGGNFDFMQYGKINVMKLDAQGKILIGGAFNGFNGFNSKGVVRLNTDGIIDPTLDLGVGLNDAVKTLAIQPNHKIILGGDFTTFQYTPAYGILRINPDGSIDETFQSPGLFKPVEQVNVLMDSSIVFLGSNSYQPLYQGFVRLNSNGTIDTATAGGETGSPTSNNFSKFKTLASGKLIVIGQFNAFQGKYRGGIAVLDSVFNLDASFGPKPGFSSSDVQKTLVQPDGKIYVGKKLNYETDVNLYNDVFVKGLVRIYPDGTLDTTFHITDSLFVSVGAMAQQVDGKIIVAGMTKWFDGNYISGFGNLARFNPDGSLDPTFITYNFGAFSLNEVLIQSDGKIVLLGKFTPVIGNSYTNIARFNSDGTLDNSFNVGTGTNDHITTGAITTSGKIIIGGDFMTYNGVPFRYFGALNPDGSVDAGFDFNGSVNSAVWSIKTQSDGKIYLAAESLADNNSFHRELLRLNPNGNVDNTFTVRGLPITHINEEIRTMLPLPNGKLLVGGNFYNFDNLNASGIVRLNTDGSRDTTFYSVYIVSEPNVLVSSMSLGLDGKIVIGGNFSKVTGKPANGIALLQHDLDDYFNVSFTNVSNISCSGNGTVTAFASGGTPPYQYLWQNLNNPSDSSQVLSDAGIYTCLVQDAAGIISYASLLIDGPATENGLDLKTNLTAGPFRTGFDNTIVLNALNDGCIPTSGQLICVMDTLIHYNSAIPSPSYQNNDTLIWDFSNVSYDSGYLLPVINCTVSTAAQIGDTVSISLFITPVSGDSDTLNNSRSYKFPVINGYDPNVKSVYPVGKCDEAYIKNGQKLTYTVQFQNTGNAEAINIVVVDSLNENLNLNSLHIVGNSHDVWIEVVQNNTVKFHFDAINLPDSTTNEAASHGYVIFEIDPISDSLPHNTLISNKAEIYFDFNPAILTNSCSNTIYDGNLDELDCSPGTLANEALLDESKIHVYPNPTNDRITISTDTKQKNMMQVSITDLSGKVVHKAIKTPDNNLELYLESLETGTYILIMRGAASGELIQALRIVKI